MQSKLNPETICHQIKETIKVGAYIPKPRSQAGYRFLGWRTSRGEEAFVYEIPSRSGSKKTSTKRIPGSVFQKACSVLLERGKISRDWFAEAYPEVNKDGSCNFTTLGGVFQLLELAKWGGSGIYIRV